MGNDDTLTGASAPGDGSGAGERERLRARVDELTHERDALYAVLEHAPEAGLVHLDRHFNFLFVNSTYADSCHMTAESMIGRNHFELFPNAENEAIFTQVRDTGVPVEFKAKPFVFEYEPERGVTYWDWTLTPLLDAEGSVMSLVFSLVDVTEAVRRQRLSEALADIDVMLHSTLDTGEILRAVMGASSAAAGVESVGVILRHGDNWVAHHMDGPLAYLSGSTFTDEEVPLTKRAVDRRETVASYARTDSEFDDQLEAYAVLGALAVPLIARGHAYGALIFTSHTSTAEFAPAVVEFAQRVAASLSLAIANAQDYEAECRRAALEDALNSMLTSFMTARDPDEVLREVVDGAVAGASADYGVISVVESGRWVVRHAFGEGGVARLPVTYAYEERPVIVTAAESRGVQVVGDAMRDPHTNKAIMRDYGIAAFVAVPLVIRSEVLGVLELVYQNGPVEFDEPLRAFIDRLMVAASVALEESRVSARERTISETLQASLLVMPERLEGVRFSHVYRAASEADRVGGDFYDIFEIDERHVGMTVGDVAGKGLRAAALTSLVKNTIRARAVDGGSSPAESVAAADRALYKGSGPEMFATIFHGVLDRVDGVLTYCSAGHTVGMIVQRDGVPRLPPNSPIAGAFPNARFCDSATRLGRADSLFLYTDGLTEVRPPGEREMFGEQRLADTLSELAAAGVTELAGSVLERVLEFTGGHLRDDVAILEVRCASCGDESGSQTKIDLV